MAKQDTARNLRSVAVIDLGDCDTPEGVQIIGRYATRRLGGHPLALRIARRLSDATRVDAVVITGSNLPPHLFTSGLAGVEILDMPHTHVCERLAAAADRYDADWVVYVPGNRPFVDPALIDCLLNRAYQSDSSPDYVGYCGTDGCWERVRHLGVAGEVCHADALRRLRRNIDRLPISTGDLSLADWIDSAPGAYAMQFVPMPNELDQQDFRFAIEDEFDWECAEMFSDFLSDDRTEWQILAELVRDNQVLRGSMAQRNRVGQAQL